MGYSRKNITAVENEFEAKRNNAIYERNKRLDEVYSKCIEIRAIDNELSTTSSQLFTLAMGGKEAFENGVGAIKERNLFLQKKRGELLVANGFTADYTEVKYECELCKDTGYVGVKLCSCYRNALTLKGYESSGIANLLKSQSFESFSLDNYGEDAKGIMKKNLKWLKGFVTDFDKEKPCVLLVGGTGLGKTHLSTAVAKELIENGYDVVYETSQNVFTDFDNEFFRSRFEDGDSLTEKYFECDLLIIDDLGTEIVTSHSTSYLYNIINTRINKKLPIIISTNLGARELKNMYHDRITSRLFGDFTILKFEGGDIRKTKIKK